MGPFHRFVALGDSQTEGLNDLDEAGRPRGWADRFAERLAETTSPDLTYANLAVRGCRARHVLDVQLPVALELEPDLATVAVGMNDVLRHDFDLSATTAAIEQTVATLTQRGSTVLMMTFPDLARMIPAMGWLRPREVRLNAEVTEIARRHEAVLLDLFPLAMAADPTVWSPDRIHGSADGHRRIAEGMAQACALPADPHWDDPPSRPANRFDVLRRDAWWLGTFLGPFLYRQLRGRGPMSNSVAKQADLRRVLVEV